MGGEAPDPTYSGLSGSKFRPVFSLALAERRDHPHAGNYDDRSVAAITHRSFCVTRLSGGLKTGFNARHHETASKSAIPSPRQCPTPTATIRSGITSTAVSRPEVSVGGTRAPRDRLSEPRASANGNCASLRCPNDEPTARTATSTCAERKSASSVVAGAAPVAAV